MTLQKTLTWMMLGSMIVVAVLVAQAVGANAQPVSDYPVIGTILQFVGDTTLEPTLEATFESLEQCWEAATAYNSASVGDGSLMVCWPFTFDGPAV